MEKELVSIFKKTGYNLKKDYPKRFTAQKAGEQFYVLIRERDIKNSHSFKSGGRDFRDLELLLRRASHKKVLIIIADKNTPRLFSRWVTQIDSPDAFSLHGLRNGYDGIISNLVEGPGKYKQMLLV